MWSSREGEHKMRIKAGIILSLLLAIAVGLVGCITINTPAATPAPEVPQEVLLIWKLEPPTGAYPPNVVGEVTLLPNLASGELVEGGAISYGVVATAGSSADSMFFHLSEGEWIDVIISSLDTEVYFGAEVPGQAYSEICYDMSTPEVIGSSSWNWKDISPAAPLYGKLLYENRITQTNQGKAFTTAVRLFAWEGEGDYFLSFINFSSEKGCEIAYRIYQVGTTLGWGRPYREAKLQPWLNELYQLAISGKISHEEYYRTEAKWLEQFD